MAAREVTNSIMQLRNINLRASRRFKLKFSPGRSIQCARHIRLGGLNQVKRYFIEKLSVASAPVIIPASAQAARAAGAVGQRASTIIDGKMTANEINHPRLDLRGCAERELSSAAIERARWPVKKELRARQLLNPPPADASNLKAIFARARTGASGIRA